MSPESPRATAPTAAGDLVRLDFDLWAEGGGKTELLDTTREEVAQEANVPKVEGRTWGPRPHEIGGDFFPAGIETSLVGLPVGDEVTREFAPAEAFGERDPNLIELFTMHEIERLPEMRREDAHLDLGTVLTINGRRGRVVTLTAARVRVDFNPPFAGRKVRGRFRVTERITEPAEEIRAIVELQYGRSKEFKVETDGKTITLQVPDLSRYDLRWINAKPRVVDRLRQKLKPHAIRIVEEYVTPVEKKEKEAPAAETPSAEAAPSEPAHAKHAHPAKGSAKSAAKAAAAEPESKDA